MLQTLLSSHRAACGDRRLPALAGHGADAKLEPRFARARTRPGHVPGHHRNNRRIGADVLIRSFKGKPGRRLGLLRGQVAEIPNAALEALARQRAVSRHPSRPSGARDDGADRRDDRRDLGARQPRASTAPESAWRSSIRASPRGTTTSAPTASSISPTSSTSSRSPYDDYGHGTHVAGIIAGSGYDSNGARRGIAPAANLVVLKVLDGEGYGYISNVIAALDYAVEHRAQFNIRVINLSVAAGVYESYTTDPLTLAAKRAVQAGIVVVTAAGNLGRNAKKARRSTGASRRPAMRRGYSPSVRRATTGPSLAPTIRWPRSVRADQATSTTRRSRTSWLLASGIESLADASSLLFATHPNARLWGTVDTATPALSEPDAERACRHRSSPGQWR